MHVRRQLVRRIPLIGCCALLIAVVYSTGGAVLERLRGSPVVPVFEPHEFERVATEDLGAIRDAEVPAAADSAVVISVVVSKRDGTAVEGATVGLLTDQDTGVGIQRLQKAGRYASTGVAGEVALHHPDNGRQHYVVIRHPRFKSEYFPVSNAPVADRLHRVTLEPGLVIRGQVVGAIGERPVAGARVVARGPRSAAADGQKDRVPHYAADVQHATTDRGGRFSLAGVGSCPYLIEPVMPGLVSTPYGLSVEGGSLHWGAYPPDGWGKARAVFARGGDTVKMPVISVGYLAVRALDAESGSLVPSARVSVAADDSLAGWPHTLYQDNAIVIANGRMVDGTRYQESGTSIHLRVACRWPLPATNVSVRVSAPGYRGAQITAPLRPVGAGGEVQYQDVRLQPRASRGSIVMRIADENDRPVPNTLVLVSAKSDVLAPLVLLVRTDEAGCSNNFALGAGTWSLGGGSLKQTSVDVPKGGIARLRATLRVPLVRLSVVDEGDRPLGDVGIRLGAGTAEIPLALSKRGQWTGFFRRRVGLGSYGPLVRGLRAGSVRVEAYRHGYKSQSVIAKVRAGVIEDLRLTLVEDENCEWDDWPKHIHRER